MQSSVKTCFAGLILLIQLSGTSQEIAVKPNGDTLLIYPNGTWVSKNSTAYEISHEVTIKTTSGDPFDDVATWSTDSWMNFGRSSSGMLLGSVAKSDTLITFNIGTTANLGCLTENESRLRIQLENQVIIVLKQISPDNCATVPTARFVIESEKENTQELYINLLTQNWITLRMDGSAQSVLFYPESNARFEGQHFFKAHLGAILEAAGDH